MKLKKLKKTVNQYLFNFSLSKNLFMVFEIQNERADSTLFNVESFSKQNFLSSKWFEFKQIKFPSVIKSTLSLHHLLSYCITLKEKKNFSRVYLLKFYFIFLKRAVHVLTNIFFEYKNLFLFSFFFTSVLKKKYLFLLKNVSYPFVVV